MVVEMWFVTLFQGGFEKEVSYKIMDMIILHGYKYI